MPAKFTQGDSIRTTRATHNFSHDPPEPKTHSVDGPRRGNTMNGMPGYINAHQTESMAHARGGKGFGPHREGSVGKRGSSGAKGMGKEARAGGTTIKSYHECSTAEAGTLKGNDSTGAHHVHTKSKSRMPGQKAPPTSKGILGGTIRKAGIDNVRSKGFQASIGHNGGHRGRMERLSGSAKTHAEGRRKSVMY